MRIPKYDTQNKQMLLLGNVSADLLDHVVELPQTNLRKMHRLLSALSVSIEKASIKINLCCSQVRCSAVR